MKQRHRSATEGIIAFPLAAQHNDSPLLQICHVLSSILKEEFPSSPYGQFGGGFSGKIRKNLPGISRAGSTLLTLL